jgi:hypothetical protein
MSTNQQSLTRTLYAAIYSGIERLELHLGENTFASFAYPGIPVDPNQFGNPWSSENQTGSVRALEGFSMLVDAIPARTNLYTTTGAGVEDAYRLLLEANITGSGTAVQKAFADARGRFASIILGSAETPLGNYHPSYPNPANWCDVNDQGLWSRAEVNLRQNQPSGTIRGGGKEPHTAATVLSALPSVEPWQVAPRVFKGHVPLTHIYRRSVLNSPVQLDLRTVANTFAQWLQACSLDVYRALSDLVRRSKCGPKKAPPIADRGSSASSLQLSFDYQHVCIERPWMDPILLFLKGWSLNGVERGTMCSGASKGNHGFFPLVATSFIVVKDLKVYGTWSSQDAAAATQASRGKCLNSFGPLGDGTDTKAAFDGTTLCVPGMRVVLWLSNVLPELPPG